MKIFVCNICGEVYIGPGMPPTCPFCGVTPRKLVLAHDWEEENANVVLTDISKKNIEDALQLELSNTAFYFCAADKLTNKETSKMFKGLAKVEYEHAEVFFKLLKLDVMPVVKEECPEDPAECIEESLRREVRAVEFYGKALSEATEPRVRVILEAIMNVEKDHIALDTEMKQKFEK